jgi:multiple antibiotic resistance protein
VRGELLRYANEVLFAVATLLPIVNPFGSAPIFLSMSADLPVEAQRRLANVVGRYAFLLLSGAMLVGSYVLRLFGVSLPIVRVGGGLLVCANGWRLLNSDEGARRDSQPKAAAHGSARWNAAASTR